MKTYTVYMIAATGLALGQLLTHQSWPDYVARMMHYVPPVPLPSVAKPMPVATAPSPPVPPPSTPLPDPSPQPQSPFGIDPHGDIAHAAYDQLSKEASPETGTAALLLASTPVCGYPHAMLKDAMSELITSGKIDQNKVVPLSYAMEMWAEKDQHAKDVLCPGVIKVINENTRQRQQDGVE